MDALTVTTMTLDTLIDIMTIKIDYVLKNLTLL